MARYRILNIILLEDLLANIRGLNNLVEYKALSDLWVLVLLVIILPVLLKGVGFYYLRRFAVWP